MARLKTSELSAFLRPLGSMLLVNVDIRRALKIAADHSGSAGLIEAAPQIRTLMEDGCELHVAMRRHPDLFDEFCIEMARQGERDGRLGEALIAAADYLDAHELGQGAPGAAGGGSALPPVLLFTTLGAAVGGAGLLALPLAYGLAGAGGALAAAGAVWAGCCFLAAASAGSRARPPVDLAAGLLPFRSRERRQDEADGVARVALAEQEEGRAASSPAADDEQEARPGYT